MDSPRTHTVYNNVKSQSEEIEGIGEIKESEESEEIKGDEEIEEIRESKEIKESENIEQLKIPYQDAIEGNWKGVVRYYKDNPDKLGRQMNLDGDNVLHLAASSCRKSQCQRVLKILIDLCGDSTKRRFLRVPNIDGNNALHQVSVSGSVEAAEFLVSELNKPVPDSTGENNNDALALLRTVNHLGETPVYRAAALGHTDLVKFYMKTLKYKYHEDYWPHLIRLDNMSVLRMAVIGQHFETARWLLQSYPFLGQMKDEHGLTSLQLLAQMPTAFVPHFQQSRWKMLIYHCLPVREDVDTLTPDQMYDVENGMDSNHLRQSMDSTHHQDDVKSGMDTNHPRQSIFRKKLAVVMKAYYSLWDSLATGIEFQQGDIIYRIWKDKKNKKSLKKLVKLLVKLDRSWLSTDNQENTRTISLGSGNELKDGDDGGEKGKAIAEETQSDKTNDGGNKQKEATKLKKEARKEVYKSTSLLIATITGNVPIVQEILEQHPQAVEHVNENERNILHLAIKNRQKKIFDLIKSNPIVMSKLSKRIDRNANTILHQAADRSYFSVSLSQKLIGPAMQLQDELRWFQRVKEIIPPHYTIHHNKKDQTADELFNYWHDDLLEQAQKWVKETAQSCSTVAVLVATVVFAAAYTTPGGTNDQNGLPLLQNDPLFLVFTSMDVVAIASSLSSVAFFLSVLSSPLEYPLFVSSIPNKIMAGFILLFISMATTMLAFAATVLLLIRVERKWTKSLLYPIAFFPVPLFGLLQFPMYQSFRAMFHEINAWFFKPLTFFDFIRRSLWCKSKKHE